jgi:hypothetical protein
MKANEMRIGNLVKLLEGTVFTISSIEQKGFTVQNKEETTWIEAEEFEPIPLTEELLLKFGFKKTMQWTFSKELVSNLNLVYYLGEKGWSIGYKNYSDFSNLKYVHQLQNLWFSLTGKELQLTDKNG